MRSLKALAYVTLAVVAPAKASASGVQCPGFAEHSSPVEVDRFYANRAISIMEAGLRGDMASLDTLVSSAASFQVWRGDNGAGRRTGSAGALDMARDLHPTRFQTIVVRAPLYISAIKCEWSTNVLFRSQQPETGVTVEFKFAHGLLVQAVGREVVLFEGEVR